MIQLPANAPGKAVDDGPCGWMPITLIEVQDRIPDFSLQHGTVPDTVIFWEGGLVDNRFLSQVNY